MEDEEEMLLNYRPKMDREVWVMWWFRRDRAGALWCLKIVMLEREEREEEKKCAKEKIFPRLDTFSVLRGSYCSLPPKFNIGGNH